MGDPLDKKTLYGPLHNQLAVDKYKNAIDEAVKAGGKIEFGGKVKLRTYVSSTIQFLNQSIPLVYAFRLYNDQDFTSSRPSFLD